MFMSRRPKCRKREAERLQAIADAERLLAEDEAQATTELLRGDRNYWRRAYATLWREVRGRARVCVPPEAVT